MTEAILDFVKKFLESEYEAIVAQNIERNDEAFQSKVDALNSFIGEGVDLKISRPNPTDEVWFEIGETIVREGNIQSRTLFQIKEYLHPIYQQLYRIYVSLPRKYRKKSSSYYANFYIIPKRDTFQVISQYDFDVAPDKRGYRMQDNGLTWDWRSGIKLTSPGKFVKSWKFQSPEDPEHRAEYDAK